MQRSRLKNIINKSKSISNKQEIGNPFDEFKKSLPIEVDDNYRLEAAWKAYGSPKDYKTALWEGMIQPIDENNYKLPSIGYNEETDEYEYLNKGEDNETVAKDIRVWDNDVIPLVQELKLGGYVRTFNKEKDCWTYTKNSQKRELPVEDKGEQVIEEFKSGGKKKIRIKAIWDDYIEVDSISDDLRAGRVPIGRRNGQDLYLNGDGMAAPLNHPLGRIVDTFLKGGKPKPSFEDWYKTIPKEKNDTVNYDLEKAYNELPFEELEDFRTIPEKHLAVKYKKPNHPTYDANQDPDFKGRYGWFGNDEDGWEFHPSPVLLQLHDVDWYKEYWDKNEPESTLVIGEYGKPSAWSYSRIPYEERLRRFEEKMQKKYNSYLKELPSSLFVQKPETFKQGGKPKYKKVKSDESYYDPETNTIYYTDKEALKHELFHLDPDEELLDYLRPYYEDLNDEKILNLGGDLAFVKRFENDPNHFYSPEELGARVVAANYRIRNKRDATGYLPDFFRKMRENEFQYGDNMRDLLHMYNDENLSKIFNYYNRNGFGRGSNLYIDQTGEFANGLPVRFKGKINGVETYESLDGKDEYVAPSHPLEQFKQGGQMNVIPEGALHARKNGMELAKKGEITHKGIPVVDNNGEQQAEIEKEEIIFTKDLTEFIENNLKKFNSEETNNSEKDEIAIKVGKRLVKELLTNTDDRTGLILEVELKM